MPHLSNKKLKDEVSKELDKKLLEFFSMMSQKKQRIIFGELTTDVEKKMLGKRILLVYLIYKKVPTHKISAHLGVSPSTVARFELMCEKNHFKNTMDWLRFDTFGKKFIKQIGNLLYAPFEAKEKSLYKILEENF